MGQEVRRQNWYPLRHKTVYKLPVHKTNFCKELKEIILAFEFPRYSTVIIFLLKDICLFCHVLLEIIWVKVDFSSLVSAFLKVIDQ